MYRYFYVDCPVVLNKLPSPVKLIYIEQSCLWFLHQPHPNPILPLNLTKKQKIARLSNSNSAYTVFSQKPRRVVLSFLLIGFT